MVHIYVCERARACVGGWVDVNAQALACAYLSSMPRAGAMLSASSLAPPYISTLYHKRYDFRKKVTEYKKCVLIFSTTFI